MDLNNGITWYGSIPERNIYMNTIMDYISQNFNQYIMITYDILQNKFTLDDEKRK